MQKTFSIAAMLGFVTVVATIASVTLSRQEHNQIKFEIATNLLPYRQDQQQTAVADSELLDRLKTTQKKVEAAQIRVALTADAIAAALGDAATNVSLNHWEMSSADGSIIVGARWKDAKTGVWMLQHVRLVATSDDVYAGEIAIPTCVHVGRIAKVVVDFNDSNDGGSGPQLLFR